VVVYVPLFCLFFCVSACPRFIKHCCRSILFFSVILESSDFMSLFSCDYLSVYIYLGFAEVFLRFSRGCGRVPRSGGGSGCAPVPFVVYPPSCRFGCLSLARGTKVWKC